MKKIFCLLGFASLVACNTGDKDAVKTGDSATTSKEIGSYAYPVMYSSKFEMGDAKKSEIVLAVWKDFDNNTLNNSKDRFADSVAMDFPGMFTNGTRDSIFAQTIGYRSSFASVKSSVNAVMSVKSTDKNEDWVCVWGTETKTDKKGKTDSTRLQEIWRFNKDGKIDYMSQFIQPMGPPAK